MKRALGIHTCAAVLAAFSNAPFVHFHLSGDSDHARQAHRGKCFGGHSHHSDAGRALDAALKIVSADSGDGDAVFLTWLQSYPQTKAAAAAAALPVFTAFMIPTPAVVCSAGVPVARSHDPPDLPSSRPRSPPPFEILPTV